MCLEEEQEEQGKVTRREQRVTGLWLTSGLSGVSAR